MTRIAGDSRYYELRLVNKDGLVTEFGYSLPSVTSIIKAVRQSAFGPAAYWGYNLAIEGVAEKLGRKPNTVKKWLKDAGKTPNTVRDQRGDEGTEAHELMARLASGPVEPGVFTGYEGGVVSFWEERVRDFELVVATERPVISLSGRYVGSLDLLWYNPWYEQFELTDLKTHKPAYKGVAYEEDKIQVGGYADAWEEMFPAHEKIERLSIVLAAPDGTYLYEEADSVKYRALWRATLAAYHAEFGTGQAH